MTAKEAASEDAGTQDRSAFSRPWVKPLLIALSLLGGLALNGLIMGLVFHFTVTVPTVRAIERARLSIEASVNAHTKELEDVVRTMAPKPASSIEPVTAVQETPPPAGMVPVKPVQPEPVIRTLPLNKAKHNPDSRPSKPQPPPADPNK